MFIDMSLTGANRTTDAIRSKVLFDEESGKEFILCEYNIDADSYRFPWSNKYHQPLEDGPLPYTELRELEVEANDVFAVYRDQYYEGGVSSVYMWEDDRDLWLASLIKKDGSKEAHGRRGWLRGGGNSSLLLNQYGDAITDYRRQAIRNFQFVRINQKTGSREAHSKSR